MALFRSGNLANVQFLFTDGHWLKIEGAFRLFDGHALYRMRVDHGRSDITVPE
jgi:hypothetical protein